MRDGAEDALVLPDGTVQGERHPIALVCSALRCWYAPDSPTRVLGDLLRGSGATGSGAQPSKHNYRDAPPASEQRQVGLDEVAPSAQSNSKLLKTGARGEMEEESQPPPQAAPISADWKVQARAKAKAIIARQKAKDLYPPQDDIACEIARDFRDAGIFGEAGKTHLGCAMVGDVINRHTQRAHISSARQIIRRLRDTWRRDAWHPGGIPHGQHAFNPGPADRGLRARGPDRCDRKRAAHGAAVMNKALIRRIEAAEARVSSSVRQGLAYP